MRKLVTVLTATAALTVGLAGTASAGGVVGYYPSYKSCVENSKKFATIYKVRVGPCQKNAKGWYFKY
jgi:hypothetical protein